MKYVITLLITLFGASTLASLPEGTYSCKNYAEMPNNVYKFSTQKLDSGAEVIYVDVQRFVKASNNADAPTEELNITGVGVVSKRGDYQMVMLGALTFEFKDGILQNCLTE